ncbi:hypothetical protein V7S43_010560 [Phytophthora oleae]|uniref:Uncharacterized protein n=1 Tax=Phytophthora oleae TaxID=2107226 RepID=A0ABD3FD55_9STRA
MDIKEIDDIVRFTGSEFYVRKEILCVLENFKKTYHDEFDTGTVINKQFVLMGSPGTGKSCILALICFYTAVKYNRPVVWFRQVGGVFDLITTRLFYEGKYYKWEDSEGENYEKLFDCLKAIDNVKACWFCLDGMPQRQVVENNGLTGTGYWQLPGSFQ